MTKNETPHHISGIALRSGRRHDFLISNTLKHNKHHATCSTTIVSL